VTACSKLTIALKFGLGFKFLKTIKKDYSADFWQELEYYENEITYHVISSAKSMVIS
jgi:hypothetical protein